MSASKLNLKAKNINIKPLSMAPLHTFLDQPQQLPIYKGIIFFLDNAF
jgi:hypothetical protein